MSICMVGRFLLRVGVGSGLDYYAQCSMYGLWKGWRMVVSGCPSLLVDSCQEFGLSSRERNGRAGFQDCRVWICLFYWPSHSEHKKRFAPTLWFSGV